MSIENPTLAHFRHFSHSVPRSFPTDCTILKKGVRIITYFQTHSFLTNKANFGKAQMNVNVYYIKDYQISSRWPDIKTNPIQTQFQIGSQKSEFRSQKPDYLLSVLCSLFSVLCFLMQPKLLNFHRKNSLTVRGNSLKYLFL